MGKAQHTYKQDIEATIARIKQLETDLQALPTDHADNERASIERTLVSERLLLARLQDLDFLNLTKKFWTTKRLLIAGATLLLLSDLALYVWQRLSP